MRSLLVAGFLTALLACGSQTQRISAVEFDPNPGSYSDGRCSSTVHVVSIQAGSTSLLAMSALFRDSEGRETRLEYGVEELAAVFPALEVPGKTETQADMMFELGAELTPPIEGSIVLVGTTLGNVTTFVGSLRCEAL